jgi:hypothetical protein
MEFAPSLADASFLEAGIPLPELNDHSVPCF